MRIFSRRYTVGPVASLPWLVSSLPLAIAWKTALYVLFCFILLVPTYQAQSSEKWNISLFEDGINETINAFKSNDKLRIAKRFTYPISRPNPIEDISTPEELVKRFSEVLDRTLIKQISQSRVNRDWEIVGWRGAALKSGKVWVSNPDGRITFVNHQTAFSSNLYRKLQSQKTAKQHNSISADGVTIHKWLTRSFHLTIDRLKDNSVRLSIWERGNSTKNRPIIVANNGSRSFSGSGGNHIYTFTLGPIQITCQIDVLTNDPEKSGTLMIRGGDNLLLSEDAQAIEET